MDREVAERLTTREDSPRASSVLPRELLRRISFDSSDGFVRTESRRGSSLSGRFCSPVLELLFARFAVTGPRNSPYFDARRDSECRLGVDRGVYFGCQSDASGSCRLLH